MLTSRQAGVLGVVWLVVAVVIFILVPLRLDSEPIACQENYGHVEWTLWPPGPVCVNSTSPVPEDRIWGWTIAATGLVVSAPLLVLGHRRGRRRSS